VTAAQTPDVGARRVDRVERLAEAVDRTSESTRPITQNQNPPRRYNSGF
jgi:hypothetical protein